jgi:hypothetical protein
MHKESDRQGKFHGLGNRALRLEFGRAEWAFWVRKGTASGNKEKIISSMEEDRAEAINGNFLTGGRYDYGLTFLA